MNYIEKNWINKNANLFNYSTLINDIIKTKKNYIKKKYNKYAEKSLITNLKSIQKLFFSNNICESIHSKIANFLPHGPTTKTNFRDTIEYVLKEYSCKTSQIVRKDYISRTCIIIIEKLDINETKKPLEYDYFKKELKKIIAYMSGKCDLNAVEEILSSIEDEENDKYEDNSINLNDNFNLDIEKKDDNNKNAIEAFDNGDNLMNESEGDENDNTIFNMEDLDKELDIINKEKDKVLDNIDILSLEKSNSKNSSVNNELEDAEHNSPVSKFNIKDIKEERKDLNLFCLDFDFDHQNLKKILESDN